jgi:hypothetical protein
LRLKIPAPRRAWESERRNTDVFDAAATAIVFLDLTVGGRTMEFLGES